MKELLDNYIFRDMKKISCFLCLFVFFAQPNFAQEKKSKKEIKLEKKKVKFEASKKAMEIGQFGFAIRKILSSNIQVSDYAGGILYIRGDEGEFDEVLWYNGIGESVRLFKDFAIQNYYVVTSNGGQKMTASYQGTLDGVRYSFITEIAFGEKPKLQIKNGAGIEIWYTGVFDTRN